MSSSPKNVADAECVVIVAGEDSVLHTFAPALNDIGYSVYRTASATEINDVISLLRPVAALVDVDEVRASELMSSSKFGALEWLPLVLVGDPRAAAKAIAALRRNDARCIAATATTVELMAALNHALRVVPQDTAPPAPAVDTPTRSPEPSPVSVSPQRTDTTVTGPAVAEIAQQQPTPADPPAPPLRPARPARADAVGATTTPVEPIKPDDLLTSPAWREKYLTDARSKLVGLLAALDEDAAVDLSAERVDAVRRLAHQFGGSAETFGFSEIASVSRTLEAQMSDPELAALCDSADVRSRLHQLLRLLLDDAPPPSAGLPSAGSSSAGLPPAALSSADSPSASLASAGSASANLPSASLPSASLPSAPLPSADSPRTGTPGPAGVAGLEHHSVRTDSDEPLRFLLVHEDGTLCDEIARLARKRDIRVDCFDNPGLALERAKRLRYDLVTLGGGDLVVNNFVWVAAFRETDAVAPIFVISDSEDTRSRIAATRAGVDRFIDGSSDVKTIVDEWCEFLAAKTPTQGTALVVDDDPMMLEAIKTTLRAHGVQTVVLSDAFRIFEELDATRPDLLLCDVDMPDVNGLELTKAIRGSQEWSQLPIIVMTRHTDFDYRLSAYRAGADDFMYKPLVPDELVARVSGRLERESLKRDAIERDPGTKVYNRTTFLSRAEHAIEKGHADGRSMAVATVEFESLTNIIQLHGLEAGDAALACVARRLEEMFTSGVHVVGRISGETFAVLKYDTTVHELSALLSDGLQSLESDPTLFHDGRFKPRIALAAGVAPCMPGHSLRDTIDRAMAARQRGGQITVCQVESRVEPTGTQVYVVDDDTVLREMLEYAITSSGFRCTAFERGDEILEALLRASVSYTRPIVMLDVDMPGMDGLSVLRELELERPGHYRVMMMSADGSESARMGALRMGAVDYLLKPIDINEIIERVRGLLAEDERPNA